MKSKRYMMLSLVAVSIAALPAFAAVLLFSMTGCAALRPDRPDGFVSLAEAVPDAILEPRYYSTYNFIGDRMASDDSLDTLKAKHGLTPSP